MKGKKKKNKLEYIVKEKHFVVPEVNEPQVRNVHLYTKPFIEIAILKKRLQINVDIF